MSLSLVHQIRSGDGSGGAPAPAVVLLHGLGSDETDLMQIGEMLDSRLTVITVRAPRRTQFGGYSWFEVRTDASGFEYDVDSAKESLHRLIGFLRELKSTLDLDPSRFMVGGFSQGAMMSLGAAIAEPNLATSVMLWSGMSLPEFEPGTIDDRLEGVPVLIQHGTLDPVLPVAGARKVRALTEALSADVTYAEYPMAHSISNESLEDAMSWIANQL